MSLISNITLQQKMVIRTTKELAAVIQEQRRRLNWTQEELATQIGVNRKWVSDFERGKPTAQLDIVLMALNALMITISIEMPHQQSLNDDEHEIDLGELLD